MKRPAPAKFKCRHGTVHTRVDFNEMVVWSRRFPLRVLKPGACWFRLRASMATAAEVEAATAASKGERPC